MNPQSQFFSPLAIALANIGVPSRSLNVANARWMRHLVAANRRTEVQSLPFKRHGLPAHSSLVAYHLEAIVERDPKRAELNGIGR